ncbi:hypothetical protein GCM10010326_02020 [Streptomyces xanthochromogenes]|uniref:CAAX prenyl protease 2/Lysostaphin resistance protein A-like domain-containing protein n=2 Tax=Streptomyces xanthochromogenes TaxID=67384 RepID=A0ABQ2ZED5_9ACTN|nr:hypothetical protein GCM10010326_02020 [Streptomyces xanthochromogenes]
MGYAMTQQVDEMPVERWRGFFGRPAVWKAVAMTVAYLAYYLLVGLVIGTVFGDEVNKDDLLSTGASIFFGLVLPIAVGAVTLLGFTASIGWLRRVFGRQDVTGRRPWMWAAPALVVVAIVGHVGATGWNSWQPEQIALIALLGICVGLAEELMTRGLVVQMLRGTARSERFVMGVSSLLFALMHMTNLLSGIKASTVLVTIVYTFGFGVCMYLTMRVTGTIWAAIILHAFTDPTTFLASGGVDESVTGQSGTWSLLAAMATILMIVFSFVAVFLVRGRRQAPVVG